MSAPLPLLSPKNVQFALTRLSMRTLGRLSDGIRLGLATGFDSGSTLDYVYCAQPRGTSLLGCVIDRSYLDAVGWRGIRVRKQHLQQAIAAAHPRHCRRSRTLCIGCRGGLGDIARFDQGDAFDAQTLAAITPPPTLALVSGLYELFSDNDAVRRSLSGLARAMQSGSYLIYTGQPWHPQLEMIARTLTSHRGHQSWVMRRRTQAELDALVSDAGFEKQEQRTGQWKIFTVTLARRK